MRPSDQGFECTLCGAALNIASALPPRVKIHSARGATTMRVLTREGDEIHRCRVPADVAEIHERVRKYDAALEAIEEELRLHTLGDATHSLR